MKNRKKIIERLYWVEALSPKEIVERTNIAYTTVLELMRQPGFPRWILIDDLKILPVNLTKDIFEDLYWMKGLGVKDIAKEFNISVDIVDELKRKFGIDGMNPTDSIRSQMEMLKERRFASPNKSEKLMDSFIQKVTKDFRFNGDFSERTCIGGRIPDWVNVKDRKQVIELFGEHWHSPLFNQKVKFKKTYNQTIEHYKKFGFDCLIIWCSELKKPDKVMSKILSFIS